MYECICVLRYHSVCAVQVSLAKWQRGQSQWMGVMLSLGNLRGHTLDWIFPMQEVLFFGGLPTGVSLRGILGPGETVGLQH